MSLPSLNLDAFAEVARQRSFSQAAARLNLTQSALSQRVLNLEAELGSSLFIRESTGVRLTDLGHRLLRYCHSKTLLETEFLESLKAGLGLSGIVRVAGFSTINRSVVMPLFAGLLKDNPRVSLELRTKELRDLPPMLFSGAADMILVNQPVEKQGIENARVGFEEYVLVQSTAKSARHDVYLDHDEEDSTTVDFLRGQSKKIPVLKRIYLGDIYGIIEGVRLGMGRAVVPVHLIQDLKGIEIVKGISTMKVPVHLAYYTQSFYTDLQKTSIELLEKGVPKILDT